MPTGHSILCPVDFSEQSRHALRWAATIARCRGGEVTALAVVDPLLAQAAQTRFGFDLAASDARPALLAFVADTLGGNAGAAITTRVETTVGEPPAAILQAAGRLDAAVIVMGTHGLGGLRKLLLGSTTEQVLSRTDRPVLAVPAGAVGVPPGEHPKAHLTAILAATDFQSGATGAVHWSAGLAASIGVPLVLTHVVEPVFAPDLPSVSVAELEEVRVRSAQERLARVAAGLPGTLTEQIVSVGRPAETIASLATERGARLVALGLADAAGPGSRKPGAVAYRILRTGHVAVVVVPPAVVGAGATAAELAEQV